MVKGVIKRVNPRGFGFVAVEGESKDIFFHVKELQGVVFEDLHEGDWLEFEVMDTDKGPQARNVRKAEAGASAAPAESAQDAE
jgi:CspA family cold shock protein